MKSLKIVLASVVLAVGVIAFSAFKAESYDSKAFATASYIFSSTVTADDVVRTNPNPIQEVSFKLATNWTPITSDPASVLVCNPTNFLCAIKFDDSQYTLAQALNLAWAHYNTNGTLLPNGLDVDPGANVVRVYVNNINN